MDSNSMKMYAWKKNVRENWSWLKFSESVQNSPCYVDTNTVIKDYASYI